MKCGFKSMQRSKLTKQMFVGPFVVSGTPGRQPKLSPDSAAGVVFKRGYLQFPLADSTGEGIIGLARFTPSYTFRNNVIAGANASQYPPNNFYPASLTEIGFMNPGNGDYRLSPGSRYKRAGNPPALLGCDFERLPRLSQ